MQDNKNNKDEEKLTDIKGSLESLVEGELPEVSQEEAIKAYRGEGPQKPKKRKKTSSNEEDDDNDDYLRKLKQELLASLEKVNRLARQLFGEKSYTNVKDFKVKKEYQRVSGKEKLVNKENSKKREGKEREEWIYL